MSSRRRLPTLRARMARHVLLPLAAVWLTGAAIVLVVVSHSSSSAYDRALLDDALGLSASVVERDGLLQVELSGNELGAVLFDQSEIVYYAVRDAQGRLVAGQAGLPSAPEAFGAASPRPAAFADVEYQGEILRAVRLQREIPASFSVVLAQTTRLRGTELRRLLLYALTPLLLLLLGLGWWLGRAIEFDLHPLVGLQNELERREGAELQPLAVATTTHDVQRLVHAIDGLMDRLRTLIDAQREFSGNVAHELRTPLAGIRALAEYGLARDDPALWREQLSAIVQSQERASRMVDQLLALALADEARSAPTLVPLALDDLVRRVLLRSMPRADALGVDLGAQGIDDEVRVLGDAGLIEGALQNLLDNALRYGRPVDQTEPAHVTVGVTVDVTAEVAVADGLGDVGGSVILSVTDNGPGIEPARHAQLLERWQQGEPGRQLGQGAGLGLAIVARFAHLLQAGLSIARGPDGRGACVSLRLLSVPAPAGASRSPSGSAASPPA